MESSPNSPSYCHTFVSELWVSRMLAFSSSILHQNPKFLRIYITLRKQWTSPLFPTCYPITASRASANWKRTPRLSSPCSGWVEVSWRESREVKKEGPVCAKPWCLEPLGHQHDRSVVSGLGVSCHSFVKVQAAVWLSLVSSLLIRNRFRITRSVHAWAALLDSTRQEWLSWLFPGRLIQFELYTHQRTLVRTTGTPVPMRTHLVIWSILSTPRTMTS